MNRRVIFEGPMLSPNSDGTWKLMADWRITFRGETYQVPFGFITDGASIPRFLWRVCGTPMDVPRLYAAIVHDYLYAGKAGALRADADDLFRDMQIDLGVPRWKAYIEWAALRIFGSSHWQGLRGDGLRPLSVSLALLLTIGCASDRVKDVELDGLFMQGDTGTMAIGSIEVTAAPDGNDGAVLKWDQDTPWINPTGETMQHVKVLMSGSNTVQHLEAVVSEICRAISKSRATISAPADAKDGSAPVASSFDAASGNIGDNQ